MAPIEHEALIGMARGLMLIDDAVIADASGLARTREIEGASASLAAVAAPVERLRLALAKVGAGVAEVHFETFDASHVSARLLGGRAEGATLLTRSTSLRANPLALDAVAHVAAGGVGGDFSSPAATWRGTTERRRPISGGPAAFFDDLERELGRSELRALVFGAQGKVSYTAAEDGPAESVRTATFLALDAFAAQAARLLHGAAMSRVDVVLRADGILRWSALGRESLALVVLPDDGSTSPALVERLSGRLRRGIDAAREGSKGAPKSANGSLS